MSITHSSVLSHLILAGTGVYCLVNYSGPGGIFSLPCLAYTVVVTNSMLDVCKWGVLESNENVEKVNKTTSFLRDTIVLPFVVTRAWSYFGFPCELAYLHLCSCLLPLTMHLMEQQADELTELIVTLNCESLVIISAIKENVYGVLASICYLLSRACISNDRKDIQNLPAKDLSNYFLAFFCYLSMRVFSKSKCDI